jgi:hypothetical protein
MVTSLGWLCPQYQYQYQYQSSDVLGRVIARAEPEEGQCPVAYWGQQKQGITCYRRLIS